MRRWLTLLLLLLSSACSEDSLGFSDSVDLDFDFSLLDFGRPQDSIHDPYVAGSSFRIYATRGNDDMNIADAYPVSLDSSVLAVDEVHNGSKDFLAWDVRAVSPGQVRVNVLKNQMATKSWDHLDVEVLQPDRVELYFAGWQLLGLPQGELAEDPIINVVVGGTATFLVKYYNGTRELHGNGALSLEFDSTQVDAQSVQTFLFEDREWLAVSPFSAGTHEIDLFAAGQFVQTVRVRGVTEEEVAYLQLHPQKEGKQGSDAAVLAVGYSEIDVPVYGIEYEWALNGQKELGDGDLYRYNVDRDLSSDLVASFGPLADAMVIHIEENSGMVDSSNNVGCGLAPDGSPRPLGSLALLMLAGICWMLVRLQAFGKRGA